ncbi:hypothetical protein YC2023_029975 [Brassica napus]
MASRELSMVIKQQFIARNIACDRLYDKLTKNIQNTGDNECMAFSNGNEFSLGQIWLIAGSYNNIDIKNIEADWHVIIRHMLDSYIIISSITIN